MNNEFIVKDSPVIDRNYCEQSACSSRYIARVLIHQQPELVPTHWHAGLETNYVVEGSGTVTIGYKVEALYPGKMCIISRYELHSFVEEKRNGKNPLIISMTYDDVRLRQVSNW